MKDTPDLFICKGMLKWLTDYDLTLQLFFQSFQAEIGVVLLYSVCVKKGKENIRSLLQMKPY